MNLNLNTNLETSKPKISSYISICKFLAEYYSYRKFENAKFSYEAWASELNFQSKSSVSMMARGQKKISDSFIEAFCKIEKLSLSESEHLYLLASYQNAKQPILKRAYLDKIIERMNYSEKMSDIKNHVTFLTSTSLPVLQLLISFKDFKATVSKLKSITGLDIKQIEDGLNDLQRMGLAQSNLNETEREAVWTSKIKYFIASDSVQEEALKIYHQLTTQEAFEALNKSDDLKKFKSLFFSLSENDFTYLKQDFEDFISKLINKYGSDYLNQKQLYKINLQAYPVTQKLNEPI